MSHRSVFVSLLAVLAAVASPAAHAAYNLVLCVSDSGFLGDSTLAAYVGCSDLTSVGEIGFIDGTTPIARDIKIVKYVDSMSNALRRAMVNGTTISELKISAYVGGVGEPQRLRLLGTRISADATSFAITDTQASESVSLMPARIEFMFRKVNQDLSLGTATYTCWDVVGQSASAAACQ